MNTTPASPAAPALNIKAADVHTYDAIVIGSGISGGFAAKELCELGLRTLSSSAAGRWNTSRTIRPR